MENVISSSSVTETKISARKIFPCDAALRQRLLDLRGRAGWSNNAIAKRLGVNSALVSQYLNDAGCVYEGDVPRLERGVADLLENEARRRASGVETAGCSVTEQIFTALEYIRKTSDIGVVMDASGDGKTRGIERYLRGGRDGAGAHPTAILYRTFTWAAGLHDVEAFLFDAVGRKNWDGQGKRILNTIKNLLGSDRLIIVDDAHKLSRPALQFFFDLHDATLCPVAFVGTPELIKKLEDDPQRFSRVGLQFEIAGPGPGAAAATEQGVDRTLLKHLVLSLVPEAGAGASGELAELLDLCEQVAREHGRYRSVHKQLKVAVELKSGSRNRRLSLVEAFKAAHTMLVRNYSLN
jgi:DNA transposition AAA+ family ATPase